MRPRLFPAALWILIVFAGSGAAFAASGPPVAPERPVTDTYFGTTVVDNYRYMENLKDPEVQAWMKAQSNYTRAVLDRIPGRARLAQQIQALLGKDLYRGRFTIRGNRYFYRLLEPGSEQPRLAYRDGLTGEDHVLVDPVARSKGAAHHAALDWYSPSWDGRYVAYGLSEGGSEESVMHVLDLNTNQDLSETIDRTSECVVSWRPDNHSFFYLRYPKLKPDTPLTEREYNARTYLHVLGEHVEGDGDEAVFGKGVSPALDVPEGQATYVLLAPDSPYAIAVANRNMDDNPNTFYVAPLDQIHGAQTPWQKVAVPDDGVTGVQLHGDQLLLLSEKGASHFQILSTPVAHPDIAHAAVLVPEASSVLDSFTVAADGIYLGERAGTSFQMRRVSFDGKDNHEIALPFKGTVSRIVTDPRQPGAMFNLQGWVQSPRELAYDPNTDHVSDTALIPPASVESSDVESREEFATSYDGTRVPVSILMKKGTRADGHHPTIVFGYGSYGISIDPAFAPSWQAWLDRGGIVVISHMRGGGEYGDAWHRAGQKQWKINTIFDFLASAQYMIDQGFTKPAYLAANSGSAGGIVMGGALTVNPALFRVVLDDVGVSDTLRFETEPNGPPNVPEMGSTSTEEGFHGLYAMSAYDHISDGTPYPAVMFTTGANDPRVSSWHMMKMAARVQKATSSGRPVLLRIDFDAGHGFGSGLSQYANELADEWSFALWQMGESGFQPKK